MSEIISKCKRCRKEFDSTPYTAYLPNREKIEGLCQDCKGAAEDCALYEFADGIMEALTNHVNGGNTKALGKALCDSFIRKHRYLQGEVMQALWHFFSQYKDTHHDPRNEWAVKYAGRCYEVISPKSE